MRYLGWVSEKTPDADLTHTWEGPGDSGALGLGAGELVGGYTILERIGEGGMGVVYAAYDPELDRKIALKVIEVTPDQVERRERLLREARALAAVVHPNVVTVHGVGVERGWLFIAMEFIRGMSLRAWIERNGVGRPEEALEILLGVARGLEAVHEAGIVHRDVKPSNVVVGDDGRVRLIDFGIAWVGAGDSGVVGKSERTGEGVERLTVPGKVVGTPRYMAPELRRGEAPTVASDLFSFCLLGWEMLTGRWPFDGRTVELRGGEGIESGLRAVLRAGLEEIPRKRPRSMRAVVKGIERAVEERAGEKGARRRWWVGGVVGSLAVGAGWWSLSERPEPVDPCASAGMSARLIWNDDARKRVENALNGMGLSYGDVLWQEASEALDDYVAEATKVEREVCEASRQTDALPASVEECVRLANFRAKAVIRELSAPDGGVIESFSQLLATLPSLEHCAAEIDGIALWPQETSARLATGEVRAQLARGSAARVAGRTWEAATALAPLVENALAIGFEPVVAEAWLEFGKAMQSVDHVGQAYDAYLESYRISAGSGPFEAVARSAIGLLEVSSNLEEREKEASVWSEVAEAAVSRVSKDLGLALEFARARSAAHWAGGKYPEALDAATRALEISVALHGEDSPEHLTAYRQYALLMLNNHRFEEGAAALQDVLGRVRRALPVGHPTRSSTGLALVGYSSFTGLSPEETEEILREAWRSKRKLYGTRDLDFGQAAEDLCRFLLEQAKCEEALSFCSKGDRVQPLDSKSAVHWKIGMLLQKSEALRCLGRNAEAVEAARAGQAFYTKMSTRLDIDSRVECWILHELAEGLSAVGSFGEAEALLRKGLLLVEDALPPNRAIILSAHARIATDAGRLVAAKASASEALAICHQIGCEDRMMGDAKFAAARVQWVRGNRTKAVELAREALSDYGDPKRARPDVAALARQVERWLAERR